MTKALVHGNPETAHIWTPLVRALADRGVDDVVTLSPPGFGAPTPAGWSATPAAYVDWLHAEVERLDGPVDLLGHDWGAGHVAGLAAAHPDSIRSWSIDIAGILHPDYVWHDAAQAWQTPGLGEQVIEAMVAMSSDERVGAYLGLGLDEPTARPMAAAFGETMGACILGLYRGAAQPFMRELGDRVATAPQRPSFVLNALDDPYVSAVLGAEVAARLGSQSLDLVGHSHWWMLSATDQAADALVAFWRGLDG